MQRLRLGQKVLRFATLLGRADQAITKHILFRDDRQITPFKPVFQSPNRQKHSGSGNVADVLDRGGFAQSLVAEQSL